MVEKAKPLSFKTVDNQLSLKPPNHAGSKDGVTLDEHQQQYLLPHFLLLLVGKPGSGKTTVMKQLITEKQMYRNKFDHIMIVSPSFGKTDIKIDKRFVTDHFNLEWVFSHIEDFNNRQIDKIFGHTKGGQSLPKDYHLKAGHKTKTVSKSYVMKDMKSRFFAADMIKAHGLTQKLGSGVAPVIAQRGGSSLGEQREKFDNLYKELKAMPIQVQQETHINALLILDDVVSEIKRQETNPLLAQLVMNRRHIIFNGTLSIIMVTQKYTLIPARIRSNANWLILFQLNPLDFENVYRDVVVHDLKTWREILQYVFGTDLESKETKRKKGQIKGDGESDKENVDPADDEEWKDPSHYINKVYDQAANIKRMRELPHLDAKDASEHDVLKKIKDKKYDNLSVWVEYNVMFKNFKRLDFQR